MRPQSRESQHLSHTFSPEEDIAAAAAAACCKSAKAFQQPHENLQLDSSVWEIITGCSRLLLPHQSQRESEMGWRLKCRCLHSVLQSAASQIHWVGILNLYGNRLHISCLYDHETSWLLVIIFNQMATYLLPVETWDRKRLILDHNACISQI